MDKQESSPSKKEPSTATQGKEQQPETTLPVRREPVSSAGPVTLMRRLSEDMDRLFEGFFGTGLRSWTDLWPSFGELTRWPEVEVFQRGDKLVVKADVPGMKPGDLKVEIVEDQLLISGERVSGSEFEEGGYYRSERSYGSFHRAIPLPRGAKLDSASASFDNGVLSIEVEIPEAKQPDRRRVQVREGAAH